MSAALITLAVFAHADLSYWVQHQPAGPLLDVLLRSMPLPGDQSPVRFRRPPSETRPAIAKMIGAEPKNAALYRLRAQEAEMQLDFPAAETDWKAYADLARDRGDGYLELADFYQRRVRAAEEIAALETVGASPSDRFVPPDKQRSWIAYARMLPVIRDAGLPAASASIAFRSWIDRYPKEEMPRQEFVGFLADARQYAAAEAQIAAYARVFPNDAVFPVEARANVAAKRDSPDAALQVYAKGFRPLWPKALLDAYFKLLDENSQLRDFEARARAQREKNPGDIDATARLFAYYQHTNNAGAARRALLEYRLAKEAKPGSWTPAELRTLAGLFERLPDANEQARAYYALYSAPGVSPDDRETALSGMIALLLQKPDQPIRFGSGDLSLYKDIGTADSSPGFLNGLLSLVLNSTTPRWQYQQQNAAALAYFHRAEGAKLLDLLEKQFPASPHRASLRSSLIDAHASYGDDNAVITEARAFLTAFPRASERTHAALALADALARQQRTQEEFAVYQRMLTELAARAGGVPLGIYGGAVATPAANMPGPRSAEYAQVLDKYLARVAAVGQPMEALRIYRRELDRNPNDPGIYERFAGFLERNNLGADVQEVYRRAIAKFPDKSWYDKLARWYLRTRQQGDLGTLTREATGIFTGTELDAYFGQTVNATNLGAALNLQLNLYAHQRFPEDLVFVHNLLNQYAARGTANPAAATGLLRDYWFYDAEIKRRYFERLSSRGELVNQIAALRQTGASNPAALQFRAEAEAWLSHFEAAAPGLREIAELYPGSLEKDARASSIYRSLAAYFPADTRIAASLARNASLSDAPDGKLLETVGDVYADKEDFAKSAASWNAIPRLFPGKPDGYIEAATVYWDYYRFNDALRLIREARTKYRNTALFAYAAGAIEEGRRDYARAVEEYLAGWRDGNERARTRIVRLATRPAQRDLIYRMTANADAPLRIAVLKAQQRRPELEAYLSKEIAVETRIAAITPLVDAAREQGFETVAREGLEREIAVTLDPVERMRLRIELAKHFEAGKDIAAAARTFDALYRDNPMILGVVRARVDFEKRNKRDEDAIAALTEAAAKSRADLSAQFRFEAARIATNAGRIDEARGLLTELLKAEPYRADYVAQMAETYVAANDDAGFIQFASAEIDGLKKAPRPAEDRKSLVAALRRRLIATLTRRNDYPAAVDQYIEVVNAYPEDDSVAREAALFASAHNRNGQLISFYRKTIAEAPRDWRWPIVLARIETAVEDYPAALSAYDTAMKARPDRADLVEARVTLEERLLRFDDAIASYTRLYRLTYNDPEWLDKAAEMQARLGRGAEAVATLERAHIGAGGETVTGLFQIAAVLDQCHLETDAARYAERGYRLAGNDLAKYPAQLETYARVMTEVRRNDAVLAISPDSDAVRSAGILMAELYTPEDKTDMSGRPAVGRTLAETAGLEDNLALKLAALPSRQAWISLQSRRGLYEQLSRDLEALANRPGQNNIASLLSQAVTAASKAGSAVAEIRIYARMQSLGALRGPQLNRYLELLLAQNPGALVAQRSDQAVQIAIAAGNQPVAMDALRARSASLPPVWLNSYTALTGVYFDDRSPAVNQAFLTVLDPRTIGRRLASKADVTRSLVGSVWFYYGARYGEYLAHAGSREADDYLASDLESRPGDPEAYISLGRFDADAGRFADAIVEFRKALDLDPDRGEAHDGIAHALMQQGRQAEATAEWREALAAFQREQSKGVRVRETFWANVSATIRAIAAAKVFAELQADIHSLLADYVHRNGGYRVNELVEPTLEAAFQSNAGQANTGMDWLLDVMAQTGGAEISLPPDASPDERERLARFRLAYSLREAALATGYDKTRYEEQAISARADLIQRLLTSGKTAEALSQWSQFSPAELETHRSRLTHVEIQLAAANGTIDQLLSRFRSEPASAPPMYELLSDSTVLRQQGHVPAALSLLEFVYTRELDRQHLDIANFLGLARVHLDRGNEFPQALAALRRMTLVAGAPFEGFEPAGDLLIEFHHDAEAKEFFSKAIQSTPWDAQAKVKLARISGPADRTRLATEALNDSSAPYATRADAARMIAPAKTALTGELALLASGNKSADAARKPFFVESRLDAAAGERDPALKLGLLREALAIAPGDPRVRLAAVRAALGAGNDRLALAMYQASAGPQEQEQPYETPRSRIVPDNSLLESLSVAAERSGDLAAALSYLQEAQPRGSARITALKAEQKRRGENAKRQPIVSGKPEQTQIVRARQLP